MLKTTHHFSWSYFLVSELQWKFFEFYINCPDIHLSLMREMIDSRAVSNSWPSGVWRIITPENCQPFCYDSINSCLCYTNCWAAFFLGRKKENTEKGSIGSESHMCSRCPSGMISNIHVPRGCWFPEAPYLEYAAKGVSGSRAGVLMMLLRYVTCHEWGMSGECCGIIQ